MTFIFAVAKLIQRLHWAMRHFIIIFHLVAGLGDPAGDLAQIMIPPINALTRFAVIRCPAKVGRVNIGCDRGFKPMKLIRTDIMRLVN